MSKAEPSPPGAARAAATVTADDFGSVYGADLKDALDLDTWQSADDTQAAHARLEREIAEALAVEDDAKRLLRARVLPTLDDPSRPGRPRDCGWYAVTPPELARAQARLLAGGAAAVGSAASFHDTLAVGATQLGLCLAAYERPGGRGAGSPGWGLRLFRRDLRERGDPVAEIERLLHRRAERTDAGRGGGRERLAELARRGIRTYAERAILLDRAESAWRFGGGPFAPLELLTGSGSRELLHAGLDLLERWVESHPRFAFVADAGEDVLRTLGGALRPGEFALVGTDRARCLRIVENGSQRGAERDRAFDFAERVSGRVTSGVYRASRRAPPRVFWAHEDHAAAAATALIADALLRPYSSRPLLLELARTAAASAFASEAFESSVHAGYARRGRAGYGFEA